MHRLVLRPLLVVLTLTMLGVALVQSVGRLGVALLDEFELGINQWLSAQHVRLNGLSGSWRYLNPVVTVARVDLPAGSLADVTIELDWLESLVRNRLVARRLQVGSGTLHLELTEGRWGLRGMQRGGDFDTSGLLYHSDQLQLRAALRFPGARVSELRVDYVGTNRGGFHRHRLEVANVESARNGAADACGAGCGRFELASRDGLWPLWEDELQVSGTATSLRLPGPVQAVAGLTIAQLSGGWRAHGESSSGSVQAELEDIGLQGDEALALRLIGRVSGAGGTHHGIVDELRLRQPMLPSAKQAHSPTGTGADVTRDTPAAAALTPLVWELPKLHVLVADGSAELWAARLQLGNASRFLAPALRGNARLSRWIRELNATATAHNLRLRVAWPAWQLDYATTLADLAMDGYRGAPFVRGTTGELIGHRHAVQLSLNSEAMQLQFPQTFAQRWDLTYAQGVVQMWFKDGYLGMRGPLIRLQMRDHSASGGFAIARPVDRSEERLTLLVNLDEVELDRARAYVPHNVSDGLSAWLRDGPKQGTLSNPHFAYHGHMHPPAAGLGRRLELASGLADTRVRYHPEWPELEGVFGELYLSDSDVHVTVDRGRSAGSQLTAGSAVTVGDGATFADVDLYADVPLPDLLDFVRSTPLRDSLSFVEPQWDGSGQVSLAGKLFIPLGDAPSDHELQIELQVGLRQADLLMPELRLAFAGIDGSLAYRYPNSLAGDGIAAQTFGAAAQVSARTESGSMVLRVVGSATEADIARVLDVAAPNVATGRVEFIADLFVAPGEDAVTRLRLDSDLVGVGLDLPGEFAKPPELARPVAVEVQFLEAQQVVSLTHHTASGWLHVNERPLRGAIGFELAPPLLNSDADYLLLTGDVLRFALDQVVPDDGDTQELALPIRLANLRVGTIEVEDFEVTDAILNGQITDAGFALNVASPMLAGDFHLEGEAPLVADIEYVILPEADDPDADPLAVEMIPDLPEATVKLAQLQVGDFNYGRWRFDIEPIADGVRFKNPDALLHGVSIGAPEGVTWLAEENRSSFVGELSVGDMAEVLPHWDYAPSLETESGSLTGQLGWRGSPANVDVTRLVGQAQLEATNGRFLDVESGGGALRIFSLTNFNTIAKRMRGDFSDLTGKGLAFERLRATIAFDEGDLEFVKPLKLRGTGSKFEVGGRLNLVSRTLNNQMVVTLPVSKSLPWYAMYLTLAANPLAGAGVIVGERVLRKPIETFSSAKYSISGTFDEPVVNLVGVFDTSIQEPSVVEDPAVEPGAVEPAESIDAAHGRGREGQTVAPVGDRGAALVEAR